jgi:glutaminase
LPAANLKKLLPLIADSVRPRLDEGRVADYIPALACIDRRKFGIAVITTDGALYAAGDAEERFSIQSISKVFTLTLALEKVGAGLWDRVGREPSGTSFNSIVQLERESGIPRNPFINAGAIVVTDVILDGRPPTAAISEIVGLAQQLSQDGSVAIDPEVARSEAETGFRNASLANFMKSFGNLESSVEDCLQTYFHQCALSMSCVQLARAGLFLANGGVDPLTGGRIVTPDRARRINALMLTCGHYDASGDFAFRVGLPGKSGVGGGILAVAPKHAAVAVWSPGLNANGNSLAGSCALEMLSQETGWSIFS